MAGGGDATSIFLFVPNLIGYVRIILAFASFYYMPRNPIAAAVLYLSSELLDAVDGHAARWLNQTSKVGAVLDMVTDRCCTACLLVTLCGLYPAYQLGFQFLIFLDITSHWVQMYSAMMKGSASHKSTGIEDHPLLKLYYTSRPVLFFMCAGNEMFFAMLYLMYFGGGPTVRIGPAEIGLWKLFCCLSAPVFVVKNLINVIQMIGAFYKLAEQDVLDRKRDK